MPIQRLSLLILLLLPLSGCLPAMLEADILREDQQRQLEARFNRTEALHLWGEDSARWVADQRHYVYAGFSTPVRIQTDKYTELSISDGTLRRDSSQADLYYIENLQLSGLTAHINARRYNKMGETNEQWRFSVLPPPLPQLRLPISVATGGRVSQRDISRMRSFELYTLLIGVSTAEFLCPCKGFTLERISKDGKRQSVESKQGEFTTDISALLAQAMSGDIYIFRQIKTACSDKERIRTLPNYAFDVE